VDAHGFVRVFDRVKDMVNRGGYKVYSVEVENVLGHHPAVLESAIVGKPCPVLGERVHAFVSLKRPVSEDELKRFCGERLADYKVPESFTLLDEPLPRNANGKLLKRALRER
jgi:acyl-CoA synthetase (AMP-forming)/AMP-acid ligase II